MELKRFIKHIVSNWYWSYTIYVGLTIFLELEGKIVDGTANDHLDELETCDDHSHDLGNSHSGGEWIVILAHVLSAHRMALRAK